MRSQPAWNLSRYTLAMGAAAALLAGCGGSPPPLGEPGTMLQSRSATKDADRSGSWMLPEAKSEDLLYVSNVTQSEVYVLSYPMGKLVGTLTGFHTPVGECVDAAGDVWIANAFSPPEVIEYAHGSKTPTATLSDAGGEPVGCAVDPTTGNLGVTNANGGLAVYQNAQGSPTMYMDPDISTYYYCAYDYAGNLFADGYPGVGIIVELPRGGSALETITLSKSDAVPISIQWDGSDLAIVDERGAPFGAIPVEHVQVSGSEGTVVATTLLKSPGDRRPTSDAPQYWISHNRIVGPDRDRHGGHALTILLWSYSRGGAPINAIYKGHTDGLEGTVVSLAPH